MVDVGDCQQKQGQNQNRSQNEVLAKVLDSRFDMLFVCCINSKFRIGVALVQRAYGLRLMLSGLVWLPIGSARVLSSRHGLQVKRPTPTIKLIQAQWVQLIFEQPPTQYLL